jgi:hypothetical protein
MKKKSAAKKAVKAATKKPSRPVAKASSAKSKPAARKPAAPAKPGGGTYTPQPIQGIGWAPFRYPVQ